MLNKSNKISLAIEVEHKKQKAAKEHNYKVLKNLYTGSNEIPNLNTGILWDIKNLNKINKISDPMAWDRTTKIVDWVKRLYPHKVINIGFGSGNVEKTLLKTNFSKNLKWIGVDISSDSVKKMQKIFPNHKFIYGKFQNIKFKDKNHDVIIASEVLEHISSSETFLFLKKIHNLLNQGGYFICSVPINENLENMLSQGINPNAHVRIYSIQLIHAELRMAGFKVIKTNLLYAFHNMYRIKTVFAKYFLKHPNNVVILAQKP